MQTFETLIYLSNIFAAHHNASASRTINCSSYAALLSSHKDKQSRMVNDKPRIVWQTSACLSKEDAKENNKQFLELIQHMKRIGIAIGSPKIKRMLSPIEDALIASETLLAFNKIDYDLILLIDPYVLGVENDGELINDGIVKTLASLIKEDNKNGFDVSIFYDATNHFFDDKQNDYKDIMHVSSSGRAIWSEPFEDFPIELQKILIQRYKYNNDIKNFIEAAKIAGECFSDDDIINNSDIPQELLIVPIAEYEARDTSYEAYKEKMERMIMFANACSFGTLNLKAEAPIDPEGYDEWWKQYALSEIEYDKDFEIEIENDAANLMHLKSVVDIWNHFCHSKNSQLDVSQGLTIDVLKHAEELGIKEIIEAAFIGVPVEDLIETQDEDEIFF